MPNGRKDPFLRYNFAVEIKGVVAGGFEEVSGLQSEIEVQEYREGGLNHFVHKLAGPVKYGSNLILKRGITDASALWDWYCDVMNGEVERRNISVLLLDSAGRVQLRWTFEQAYPVKWVGPELRANASEVAAETLEFVHRGLEGMG